MNTIKENSKSAFNQQAATYDKDIKGQHARSLYPALLEKLSHIPFQSALDLGCGTGEMLKLILQKDPHKELYLSLIHIYTSMSILMCSGYFLCGRRARGIPPFWMMLSVWKPRSR